MTFSIVGRCPDSGMLGIAITTSSICVGARCPHARAGVGAVSTQNVTDPSLGPLLLDALEQGMDPQAALDAVTAGRPHLEWRQLTLVDSRGRTAAYTGARILGINAESSGEGCYAAGNLLSGTGVPAAMIRAFGEHPGVHLGERLLTALEAGLAAGGEAGDVHSAALLVVHEQAFPLVDLRVDWSDDDALPALRDLWQAYQPQMQDYLVRALDPDSAPSYGVPGDE